MKYWEMLDLSLNYIYIYIYISLSLLASMYTLYVSRMSQCVSTKGAFGNWEAVGLCNNQVPCQTHWFDYMDDIALLLYNHSTRQATRCSTDHGWEGKYAPDNHSAIPKTGRHGQLHLPKPYDHDDEMNSLTPNQPCERQNYMLSNT